MTPKLVIFDMDGTLIDSQEVIHAAMAIAFRDRGHAVPDLAAVRQIVGLSLDHAVARLRPDLDAAEVIATANRYKDAFVELRARTGGEGDAPLYPGAIEALSALKARPEVVMGVATGKARRGLDHAYAAHGIGHYFTTHQTADNHPSKPHPAMARAACDETGIDPDHAVMVGDTTYDIEMGRAAGCRTIGVAWGYHDADCLRAAGADTVIDGFPALVPALDRIWGQA